jgi:RNA-directed DNA polymerase
VSGDVQTRFCESRGVRFPPATLLVGVFVDREDAERFREEVEERLAAFELTVAPEKTRLLVFDSNLLKAHGRSAHKPETFLFLGFTHFLTKTRTGKGNVSRTPSVKSRERFLRKLAIWLRANKHLRVREQQAHLARALEGYYQYFGLRMCLRKLNGVHNRVRWLWRQALQKRSQKAGRTCDWATLTAKLWFQLPLPRITQPWV